jgi:hypothetical protein
LIKQEDPQPRLPLLTADQEKAAEGKTSAAELQARS